MCDYGPAPSLVCVRCDADKTFHSTLGVWVCPNVYCPSKTEGSVTTDSNT